MTQNGKHGGVALVTGASSGIGSEFARVLAEHGHDLVLVARRTERLQEIATELQQRHGTNATIISADLSQPDSASEVYSEIRGRGIEVDLLINNAGFNVYGAFAQTNLDDETQMIQVNVVAVVALTKLFVRDMIQRRSGRILNLGSTGSFAPAPLDSLYAATKAFVLSFSEALSEELKGTGVTVTVLCPGPTRTEFAIKAGMLDTRIFQSRLLSARDVAAAGYDAMMHGRRIVILGLSNKIQVWSMRFVSRALVARIAKGLMSRHGLPQHAPHQV